MEWFGLCDCIFCTIFKFFQSNTKMLALILLTPVGISGYGDFQMVLYRVDLNSPYIFYYSINLRYLVVCYFTLLLSVTFLKKLFASYIRRIKKTFSFFYFLSSLSPFFPIQTLFLDYLSMLRLLISTHKLKQVIFICSVHYYFLFAKNPECMHFSNGFSHGLCK